MSNPKFTFCIPNLNKIQYLPACIDSMLSQTCGDWKCIFVDGYSTDGCWEYMQQYADDPRFILKRGLKQGMYADWNECLKHVDTEYFYFLTSDDTCYPELVSTTTQELDRHQDIDACHFNFSMINEAGHIVKDPNEITLQRCDIYHQLNQHFHRRSGIFDYFMHYVYRAIYTTITSLVFRKRLISNIGGFSTQCGSVGDFDWTMRMNLATDVLFIPKLLATWRIYEEQATKCSTRYDNKEKLLKIAIENLNLFAEKQTRFDLAKPIDRNKLIKDFRIEHASSAYERIFLSRNLTDFLENAKFSVQNYPLYPYKKIINRLSLNRFYPYPKRTDLAHDLIYEYGLKWPSKLLKP